MTADELTDPSNLALRLDVNGERRQSANTKDLIIDIPGLIEGAHAGVGLGTRFLGHVERCKVMLHLIDATAEDVVANPPYRRFPPS